MTPMAAPEKGTHALRMGDAVFAREFDGELVILDLAGGEYYGLNEVGARIWARLVEGDTPEDVATLLAREYRVERDVALHDVLHLVRELESRKLLTRG